MSNFNRFQEKNKIRANSINGGNSLFIDNGYNSRIITNLESNIKLHAAIVNEQEKDSAYIYTHLNEPLTIGSMWEAKSLYFLITEEIIVMKDVQWHKYLAVLCNCNFDGIWGYFKGPEETYINIALKHNTYLTSLQKPLIILPENTISFGDKIVIKNRSFLVQEIDNISTPGIAYCSLQPTTVSNSEKQVDKEYYIIRQNTYKNNHKEDSVDNNTKYFYPNQVCEERLSNGYFWVNNTNIEIIERTNAKIKFSIPFGIEEVIIKTEIGGPDIIYKKQ